MAKYKVVHYINQFYAGLGGEDTASVGLSTIDGAKGPGMQLIKELGEEFEIVKTIICGDNTIAEESKEIIPALISIVKEEKADVFVAGPGFNAGRYGLGCGLTVASVTEELGIPAITGLFEENPGTDLYKNRGYILKTDNNARHMKDAMKYIAAFCKKMVNGEIIKDGDTEGYFGSGPAIKIDYSIPSAKRGIDMLLAKYTGKNFKTEVLMPNHEQIPVPELIKPLSEIKVAVVTDGGLVPKGNPDNQPPTNSKAYKSYSISGIDSLKSADWEVSHQGYDNSFVLEDPNRLVPIDALRVLEKEGVIKQLNDFIFSTAGVMTPMEKCKEFGEGIAKDLKAMGVDAVIETSTWGTSSRGGSMITKEIQRAGIPVVQVTNLTKIAEGIGSNRILKGNSVLHVFGDPKLPKNNEEDFRKKHVMKALKLLEKMPTEYEKAVIDE